MPLTHSPDPTHLLAGAGLATDQSARGTQFANGSGVGWAPSEPTKVLTGAIAGSPGTWVPGNSYPPANAAAAISSAPAPGLPAAWTTGQFNACRDLSEVYWTGTAWKAGRAP